MREEFLGVLLMLVAAVAGAALLLLLSRRLAPAPTAERAAPIASGQRFAVRFLVVAMLFALLDLEVLLLHPWAALFRELGGHGLGLALIFLLPVAVGIYYQWRKGVFEW